MSGLFCCGWCRNDEKGVPEMSESEVARIRETIAKEYMAAKWGLTGLAEGTPKHAFIKTRMERIEEGRKALEAYVGDQAMSLIVETIEAIPEEPTREHIQEMLRHQFGKTADTEYLINDLKDVWETLDLLMELYGAETVQKMINAPPS
jgi:hypothetical protein